MQVIGGDDSNFALQQILLAHNLVGPEATLLVTHLHKVEALLRGKRQFDAAERLKMMLAHRPAAGIQHSDIDFGSLWTLKVNR